MVEIELLEQDTLPALEALGLMQTSVWAQLWGVPPPCRTQHCAWHGSSGRWLFLWFHYSLGLYVSLLWTNTVLKRFLWICVALTVGDLPLVLWFLLWEWKGYLYGGSFQVLPRLKVSPHHWSQKASFWGVLYPVLSRYGLGSHSWVLRNRQVWASACFVEENYELCGPQFAEHHSAIHLQEPKRRPSARHLSSQGSIGCTFRVEGVTREKATPSVFLMTSGWEHGCSSLIDLGSNSITLAVRPWAGFLISLSLVFSSYLAGLVAGSHETGGKFLSWIWSPGSKFPFPPSYSPVSLLLGWAFTLPLWASWTEVCTLRLE